MRSSPAVAAPLLLLAASGASALPEIAIAKRDRHTYGRTSDVAHGLVKRQGTVGTNVFDILTFSSGGAYYANVTVGTPPQDQTVILDTGSSDLYFDATTAPACESSGPFSCRGGTFDSSKSSSFHVVAPAPAFNTSFGDGSTANGPFGADTIGIGDVTLDNVQFGVAQEVNSTTGFSLGLMGIGYSENEATFNNYPNMPEVLTDAGVINSRLYSIYLNDEGATSGSILFGGIDTSKYTGTLQTVDILPDINTGEIDQFITTVTALTANVGGQNQPIFSGGTDGVAAYRNNDPALPVLLDTGSSAWSVPPSYYEVIFQAFTYVDQNGLCPCSHASSSDTLTLTFANSVQITVPARDFIIPLFNSTTNQPIPFNDDDDACAFMVVPAPPTGQGFETCGDAVLRSMYVVFDLDQGQMSLAQANVNSTSSPSIHTVAAGPSGVANAASHFSGAAATQSFSVAPQVAPTASFDASSAQSTVGSATGLAAVPANAQPGGVSDAGSGTSSGMTSDTSSGASSSPSSAAPGIVVPGADWSGMWIPSLVVTVAALGFGIML